MKKIAGVEDAKREISSLLGKNVVVKLNRGRNRVRTYNGVVQEAHSNVFVVELHNELFDRISCSYTDLLCGEVHITESASARD